MTHIKTRSKHPFLIGLALSCLALNCSAGTPRVPPKPPAAEVPDLRTVDATIACVGCSKPFDTATHKEVLQGLVANVYIGELRRALYLQDTVHQFESKVHFDNCDFDNAIAYIDERLDETDKLVRNASELRARGKMVGFEDSVRKAFFTLGQALHGVQDFYAHSNYIELSKNQAKKTQDIAVVAPWRNSGKARIKEMGGAGLVSGYVIWGLPQQCLRDAITHADLAKDKNSTPSGAVKVPHLQNQTQYQIAVYLARRASELFFADAFQRWPLLKEVNGNLVAFEVLVDRRGL